MRPRMRVLVLLASSLWPSLAFAQPQPEDLRSAAAAFSQGQRAQLRGDYAAAAEMFELADRSAPSAAALRSAIRNRRASGQLARAATLASTARTRYPNDSETTEVAEQVLAEAGTRLGRLAVSCTPECTLAIDDSVVSDRQAERFEVFVEPGTHTIAASFEGRPSQRSEETVQAGAEVRLNLQAGSAVAAETHGEVSTGGAWTMARSGSASSRPPAEPSNSAGVPLAVFITGAVLTVGALGTGIALGVETLSLRDAYVVEPTRERYDQGVTMQWLTNGFLFGAAALGLTTFILAFFTDWDGDSREQQSAWLPAIAPSNEGLILGFTHQL